MASTACSTAGGSTGSSARAATSPISAGAGANRYRYMVVLDADSVMSGDCLTALLRLSESNPDVGIIQTAPHAAGRETLYARVQQFATSVYGPLFTAGLHFWQLGESHYWGHNAIIRVAPFMRHCALGRLPGHGTLSGEILSHDFVEAALMRRAGWQVMDRLRSRRQLRGNAAEPDRRAYARPALVPGQSDELPPVPDAGPACRPPRGVHERRHGLPFRAAVVPFADPVDGAAGGSHLERAQVFRRALPAVSAVARVASGMGNRAFFGDGDPAVPAEDARRAADRRARRSRLRRRRASRLERARRDADIGAAGADTDAFPLAVRRRRFCRLGDPLEVADARGRRNDLARSAAATRGAHAAGHRFGPLASIGSTRRSCGGCCLSSAR